MANDRASTDADSTASNHGAALPQGHDKVVSAAEKSSHCKTALDRFMNDDALQPVGWPRVNEQSRPDRMQEQIARVGRLLPSTGAHQAAERRTQALIAQFNNSLPSASAHQAQEHSRQASARETEAVQVVGDQSSRETQDRPKSLSISHPEASRPASPTNSPSE